MISVSQSGRQIFVARLLCNPSDMLTRSTQSIHTHHSRCCHHQILCVYTVLYCDSGFLWLVLLHVYTLRERCLTVCCLSRLISRLSCLYVYHFHDSPKLFTWVSCAFLMIIKFAHYKFKMKPAFLLCPQYYSTYVQHLPYAIFQDPWYSNCIFWTLGGQYSRPTKHLINMEST